MAFAPIRSESGYRLWPFWSRNIYRERDGESSLSLGVSESYMVGIVDGWHEKLKPTETPPNSGGPFMAAMFLLVFWTRFWGS